MTSFARLELCRLLHSQLHTPSTHAMTMTASRSRPSFCFSNCAQRNPPPFCELCQSPLCSLFTSSLQYWPVVVHSASFPHTLQ